MAQSIDEFIQKAANDIKAANYAIALTGAGISTESGIPDFRGPDGLWTKDPEAEKRAYQAYERFVANPRQFWEDTLTRDKATMIAWQQAKPNSGHFALAELEQMNQLKCVITQNIDGLHEKAGSKNLYEYHGSTAKYRCNSCNARYRQDEYDLQTLLETNQLPPRCRVCGDPIKSDVVYFGEPIPSDVAQQSHQEAEKCDLMLICGTSAVVYPFAGLPQVARYGAASQMFGFLKPRQPKSNVTIIEINAERTPLTDGGISDYLIQGKTGEILPKLVDAVKQQ